MQSKITRQSCPHQAAAHDPHRWQVSPCWRCSCSDLRAGAILHLLLPHRQSVGPLHDRHERREHLLATALAG